MNEKLTILVACHKPDQVYKDEVYIPIHVGRAVSAVKDQMKDIIGDDTGENISQKNPNYCELTAQYWAWKNIQSEYVGLCHYRRYFERRLSCQNIDNILGSRCDVILAEPIYERRTVGTRLIMTTSAEDVYIFIECFRKLHPDCMESFMKILSGVEVVRFNMFVMRKPLFDDFAEWQFPVFEEMEKHVRLSSYSRQRRLYGYLAEVMLAVYCHHNGLRVHYEPVVSMIGERSKRGFYISLREAIKRKVYGVLYGAPFMIPDTNAVRLGLKNDKVEI